MHKLMVNVAYSIHVICSNIVTSVFHVVEDDVCLYLVRISEIVVSSVTVIKLRFLRCLLCLVIGRYTGLLISP
jgi:hypothetical protein